RRERAVRQHRDSGRDLDRVHAGGERLDFRRRSIRAVPARPRHLRRETDAGGDRRDALLHALGAFSTRTSVRDAKRRPPHSARTPDRLRASAKPATAIARQTNIWRSAVAAVSPLLNRMSLHGMTL